LFFAVRDFPNEEGYIYKIFGFDLLSIAQDLDFADIRSVFYNDGFPPVSNPVLRVHPHLFYRDSNIYNVNLRRQKGWHIIEPANYRGAKEFIKAYKISPYYKKMIKKQLKAEMLTQEYYFPDLEKIEKVTFL
jgi:hypothetical protein